MFCYFGVSKISSLANLFKDRKIEFLVGNQYSYQLFNFFTFYTIVTVYQNCKNN